MRMCFGVDRQTHRYLIDKLSGTLHPKVLMCSRYAGFHKSLLTCDKFPVRFLARLTESDQRSVFGQNLRKIGHECNKMFPTKSEVKRRMKYFPVPSSEEWRISLLKELVGYKVDNLAIPGFSKSEAEEMLKFVCIT